jgi:hypothetical protein
MMNLAEFERALAARIGRPAGVRPFVCDGSPLECHAMIVGFNPATPMGEDFWSFWRSGWGFDREAWQRAYATERANRGHGASPTRRIIERISEAARPVRFLETNVFAAASRRARDLKRQERNSVTDLLLDAVRPALVIAHAMSRLWMQRHP